MNRIDRYVGGLFATFFVGGLLVFVTIFLAIDAMSLLVSSGNVEFATLLKYYAYATPDVVYKMIPVGCLLATIFTLSTLNRSNELVALFAAGMSLIRISFPILFGVVIISVLSFFMGDRLLPNFAKQKNYIFYREIKKTPSLYSTTKADRIWYRSHDVIFNIKTLNEQAHRAQGLTMYYFNQNWDLLQMITAKEVELKGATWELAEGSVTVFTEESSFPLTSNFKKKTVVMGEEAKDLSSTGNTSEVLSLSELNEFIRRNKAAGLDTLSYEVDYQSKFGFAFAALVMSLLAIPFSVTRERSGGVMANVGICLGLVFGYWVLYSSGLTLGNHGQLPPIVAAWLPNVVMASFAGFLIVKWARN